MGSTLGLHNAVRHGDVKRTRSLVAVDPTSIDECDVFGNTALWLAARSGAVVIIKILLDAGANINKAKGTADYWSVPARDTGSTPLFVATLEGRLEAIRYLVKAGAAVDKADCNGATPLYAASHTGQVKAMRVLIKAGASVDQADDAGSSPIYIAAQSGCVPAVKLLLKNGACSAKLMFDGCSPLHVAASHGHLANVKLLTTFHPNTPAWHAFLLGSGARRELPTRPVRRSNRRRTRESRRPTNVLSCIYRRDYLQQIWEFQRVCYSDLRLKDASGNIGTGGGDVSGGGAGGDTSSGAAGGGSSSSSSSSSSSGSSSSSSSSSSGGRTALQWAEDSSQHDVAKYLRAMMARY
jgi:ankyrin repeat protein